MAGSPTGPRPPRRLSNETFGMLVFLMAEVMFFAAFVIVSFVLRVGTGQWRPPGLPPLVTTLSVSNTVLLGVSAVSMTLAWLSVRRDDPGGLFLYLSTTMALGTTFVGLQVYESYRLMHRHGVSFQGSHFGNVFYLLLGLHGLHVLGGIVFLGYVLARRKRYHRYRAQGVVAAALYWHFVVAVWGFLFFALYVY